MRTLTLIAASLFLAGVIHCGRDSVVVGIDHDQNATGITGTTTSELSALVAVRRAPNGNGHVAAGVIGCSSFNDAGCDGWMATIATTTTTGTLTLMEEARVKATPIRSLTFVGNGGDRIVAGRRKNAQGIDNAWVGRRSQAGGPGGAFAWETTDFTIDGNSSSEARAIIDVPLDGTFAVAGHRTLPNGVVDGWAARARADNGAVQERFDFANTQVDGTTVEAITIVSTLGHGEQYFISGTRHETRGEAAGRDVAVAIALEITGTPAAIAIHDSFSGIGLPVATGVVKTLLNDRQNEVTLCAQIDDGVGLVRVRDYFSDIFTTRVVRDPNGARIVLGGCTVTDDGAIIVAGTIEIGNTPPHPWATKIDRLTLLPMWTRAFEARVGRLDAVAPANGNGAMGVGSSEGRAFVFAIDP